MEKSTGANVLISVIIPLYKGNRYIEQLITEIERAYLNLKKVYGLGLEVIFVNDYPEEKITIEDVGNRSFLISVIENKRNIGIHASRVSGLRKAIGKYIHFLDQDDRIEPDFYESQYRKVGKADAIVCNGIFRETREIMADDEWAERIVDRESYFSSLSGIISPGQVLIKKDSIPSEWKEHILQYNYCDDAFLWLLMKNQQCEFVVNPDILYRHTEDGNNTSFNWSQTKIALKELLDVIQKNNLVEKRLEQKLVAGIQKKISKHEQYEYINKQMEMVKNNRQLFKNYFANHHYHSIALYGYGVIGRKFNSICKKMGIDVEYAIDQFVKSTNEMTVYDLHDNWPEVDAIIVTPVCEKEDIIEMIEGVSKACVLGIDDVLSDIIEHIK